MRHAAIAGASGSASDRSRSREYPWCAREHGGRGVRDLNRRGFLDGRALRLRCALVDVEQLMLADGHDVAIIEVVMTHALALHEHAVGAVQILDDGVLGRGDDLAVVTADEATVDLQIIGRSATDDESAGIEVMRRDGVAIARQQDAP